MTSQEQELLTRVARAICNRRKPKPAKGDAFDNLKSWADVDELNGDSREELEGFYDDARAAIEAIGEVSAEIADAVADEQDVLALSADESNFAAYRQGERVAKQIAAAPRTSLSKGEE